MLDLQRRIQIATQRVTALTTIAGYGVSQVVMALRGKDSLLPHLHDLAWFHSSRKKLPTVSLEELFPGSAKLTIQLERSLAQSCRQYDDG
jgi:hypothetical protein